MICPNCNAETSDMSKSCEQCGAALDSAYPPAFSETSQAPSQGSPDDSFDGLLHAPSDYVPPSDASFQAQGPAGRPASEWPSSGAGRRDSENRKKQWYLTPLPYVIAVLVALGVLSLLLLRGGGTGAFPELVVGGKPTLLDVYSDT